jgi:hypothetical protein
MILKIFESLFLVGSGFIPKSHIIIPYNRKQKEQEENKEHIIETENQGIKAETIIFMIRYCECINGKGSNDEIAGLVENDKLYGGDGNHQLTCDEAVDLHSEISSLNNLPLRLKSP